MSKVWVIADLHFGHAKVAASRGYASTDEHDSDLIRKWNSVVRDKDKVWVLGDCAMSKRHLPKLAALCGTKRLVGGNHDLFHLEYATYFEYVVAMKVYDKLEPLPVVLTHFPVHPYLLERFGGNIHGHAHHATVQGDHSALYLNVCAEHTDGYPVELVDAAHTLHWNLMLGHNSAVP